MRLMKWTGRSYVEADDAAQVEMHIAAVNSQEFREHLIEWARWFRGYVHALPAKRRNEVRAAYQARLNLLPASEDAA